MLSLIQGEKNNNRTDFETDNCMRIDTFLFPLNEIQSNFIRIYFNVLG